MFDNFRFDHVDNCLAQLNEQTVKQLAILEETAKRLIGYDGLLLSDFTAHSEGIVTVIGFACLNK